MLKHHHIFTDGSVNPQTKVGAGACLITNSLTTPLATLSTHLCTTCFTDTSSTQLELLTLLWAFELVTQHHPMLSDNKRIPHRYTFYTDSQNIVGLRQRRQVLEKKQFLNKQGEPLNNHLLYQQFFTLTATVDCEFVKVKGHQRSSQRDEIEKIFSLVDNAARKALRNIAECNAKPIKAPTHRG